MGSLAKTYSQEKLLGQIYTPTFIIEKILDDMDYHTQAEILGKPLQIGRASCRERV